MKKLNKTIYITLVAFLTIMTGCNSDDDNTPEPPGNSGAPHQYDVTVDGHHYSGEVDNVYGADGDNGAVSAVSVFQQEGSITMVNFMINNNDVFAVGGFEYPNGQGNNVPIADDDDSYMEFSFDPERGYASDSGTAKIVVGEKINIGPGLPQFAALQIEFQGTFSYLDDDNNLQYVSASGNFIVNLPPGF